MVVEVGDALRNGGERWLASWSEEREVKRRGETYLEMRGNGRRLEIDVRSLIKQER